MQLDTGRGTLLLLLLLTRTPLLQRTLCSAWDSRTPPVCYQAKAAVKEVPCLLFRPIADPCVPSLSACVVLHSLPAHVAVAVSTCDLSAWAPLVRRVVAGPMPDNVVAVAGHWKLSCSEGAADAVDDDARCRWLSKTRSFRARRRSSSRTSTLQASTPLVCSIHAVLVGCALFLEAVVLFMAAVAVLLLAAPLAMLALSQLFPRQRGT